VSESTAEEDADELETLVNDEEVHLDLEKDAELVRVGVIEALLVVETQVEQLPELLLVALRVVPGDAVFSADSVARKRDCVSEAVGDMEPERVAEIVL